MQMAKRRLAGVTPLLLCLIVAALGCSGNPSNPEANCELVTQGNSFLQVVNTSGGEIDVNFIGFAFEALIVDDKCETFGMPAGNRSVEVTQRPDGPTRRVAFSLAVGETFVLRVTKDFY